MSDELFAADAMSASRVAFEAMKVADLKEELLERGASRNGVKSTLQRRLHGLIVQDAISNMCAADGDTDEEGASGGEAPAGASSDDIDSEEEAMPLAERLRRL